ncbi:MAG: glycoside hydrolase family 13 protein [Clostridia bacterium]|jgi:4-alpha-glucanotransferase|nr:glycoside hydrolase family 13 protein [Clostridia bacterium]
MLSFDSRKTEYKKPFGAVSERELISIKFPINKSISIIGLSLVLRKETFIRNIPLKFLGEDKEDNIFVCGFSADNPGIYYYRFEIYTYEGTIFVGRGRDGRALIGDWLPEWQLTVFKCDFKTPEWIKGGIIYHIFADRFCRKEDEKRPVRGIFKSWYQNLSIGDQNGYRADDFYGGNIKGIISRLSYLKSLGVNSIYLSPIFESSSNHRYDTGDYFKIDPLFGDENEFKDLIENCKRLDIGIILDGVFNHTGSDSLYFNKLNHYPSIGAYQSKLSPYYDWYTFYEWPDLYECWWGVTVVPTIKRNSTEFQNLIAGKGGVIEKWTKIGVKGWRLDVVDELSSLFVEKIRKSCKDNGDEVSVIGEVWEDASTKESYGEKRKYVLGSQLDGVMNYPFRNSIIELLKEKHVESFINSVYDICENYPKCVLNSCMTLLGSHDTIRIITELGVSNPPKTKFSRSIYRLNPEEYKRGKDLLKIASIIQYVLPGVPSIYYGDEAGMQGFEDPMNRGTFPTTGGDIDIVSHYRNLGDLRKRYKNCLINSDISIRSEGKVLYIDRGNLKTVVNLSENSLNLPKYLKNELDGRVLNELPKDTAIVYLENQN